jgi:hypothetical protein
LATTYEDAKQLHSVLERKHERRHWELKSLRRYWQGDYWADQEDRAGVAGVAQLFRDLKGSQSDVGPDLKLVHNILQEVCVKYQTFLSPVPMVRTFVDPPYSDKKKAAASRKERAIYGTWWANRIAVRMAEIAWYLPLMGDCFTGIWPDFERKIPRFLLRSPEIAYPVKSVDGGTLDQIIFKQDLPERVVARLYPDYVLQADEKKGRFRPRTGKANAGGERTVEFIEYSDEIEYGMWAGTQTLKQINHDFGYNLFGQMSFIPVPGSDFNHGAVEQIVSLVEMGNALHSLMFQATLENVFPTMVIVDPSKAPEQIARGPGSVIPLNPGGSVGYLTPPVAALPAQLGFLRDNQDKILEASGMPRVAFGQSPTTSIATGAAINELQGAGTGSTVEMVQGVGIGPELTAWNEKCLDMYQTVFKKDTINLYGTERKSIADLNPRSFALTFKGGDIVGSTRNEVVFSPHMDDHEKLVMMLQALGGGLVSKGYARDQIGISDNDAMVEEILAEQLQDGVLGALVAQLQQDPSEAHAQQLEQQGVSVVEALAAVPQAQPPVPHPLLAAPAGPGGAPSPGGGSPAGTFPGGPGGVSAPPMSLPPGAPPPEGPAGAPSPAAPAPGAPAAGGNITVQQAQDAFGTVQLQGRAWLVGEIVAKGSTASAVEVAISDPADKAALQQAATFPVIFHVVHGEPQEDALEIVAQPAAQAA